MIEDVCVEMVQPAQQEGQHQVPPPSQHFGQNILSVADESLQAATKVLAEEAHTRMKQSLPLSRADFADFKLLVRKMRGIVLSPWAQ